MKLAKRIMTAGIALALTLGLNIPAFAATINITGDRVNVGETYTAYKVFDVSTSVDENETITGYSYYTEDEDLVNDLDDHGVTFNESAAGNLWYVSRVNATTLTSYLSGLEDAQLTALLGSAAGSVTISATDRAIENLGAGYYFVTSTMGSLCMLNTAADTVDIEEKNQEPTVEKTVDGATISDAQIGDTVTFTVTISVPANTERLVLNDTLSNGLTLNNSSFKISISGGEAQALTVTNIQTTENGPTSFSVNLTEYLDDVSNENRTIVVTYTATINANAIHTNPATNSATVSYGNNSTSEADTTTTSTHMLTIVKEDDNDNRLNGAEFQLKDADDNLVYVVGNPTDGYRVATLAEIQDTQTSGATTTIVVNGSVTIDGLDAETYTLTETKAPAGYNLLTTPQTINVTDDDAALITVENVAGSTLPTTGGMGTTILYIAGAALVLGAGVTLVVRRRMNSDR